MRVKNSDTVYSNIEHITYNPPPPLDDIISPSKNCCKREPLQDGNGLTTVQDGKKKYIYIYYKLAV